MTEEQLAQVEAGTIRLPIGAKDRKGVDICLGDSVHFADAAEWGATETPTWTVRMEGGRLPQPGSTSDLAQFCEVVKTNGVDPAAIVAKIRRLEAENAALRARAVPGLRFNRMGVAESGQFTGCGADNGDWALGIYLKGILVSIEDGTGGKASMDAAFLRLVGVK